MNPSNISTHEWNRQFINSAHRPAHQHIGTSTIQPNHKCSHPYHHATPYNTSVAPSSSPSPLLSWLGSVVVASPQTQAPIPDSKACSGTEVPRGTITGRPSVPCKLLCCSMLRFCRAHPATCTVPPLHQTCLEILSWPIIPIGDVTYHFWLDGFLFVVVYKERKMDSWMIGSESERYLYGTCTCAYLKP